MNLMGISGMKAGIDLLLGIGISHVSERILAIRARLVDGLQQMGFVVLGPADGPNASGIVTVSRPETDMPALFDRLTSGHIVCSPRQDREGRQYVRFSPHFYNTEAEVDRVLEVLAM